MAVLEKSHGMSINKLSKGWKWAKLGNVSEINPKIPNREQISDNLEVQFLPMKLVEELNGKIHLTEVKKYGDVKKGYTPFINGDVIFAKVTPCMENGKIAVVTKLKNNIGFGSSEFHVIRGGNEIISNYILYYVIQDMFRNEAANAMTGAVGLRRVPKAFIENYSIPLPPKAIQQAIVSKIEELFSELDKGIENLRIAQQQLKTYRQSVLKWAFEGRLTNGNVKDGELPKGWKWVKLSEVIEKPKYGTSQKCQYEIKGIGVLRIPNIAKGIIDSSDLKFAIFDKDEIDAYRLKEDDILIIRSNGSVDLVGKCALITKKDECFLYAGYLIRLRPIKRLVLSKYLLNIFSSISIRIQIEGKAKSSSGVNNINSEEIGGLLISLPPIEEQDMIVEAIESILKKAFEGKLV